MEMEKIIIDSIGRQITLGFPPQRIVSLVPSITELLFDLRLEDKIVGVTKFCVHPNDKTENLAKVGGPKDFSISKIMALQPDLVIADKEENRKDLVLKLAKDVPVFVNNVYDYHSAIEMITRLGEITNRCQNAQEIVREIQENFEKLPSRKTYKKAIYFIWKNPYMTINEHTFIHVMMEKAGFENVFAAKKDSYPVITTEEIQNSDAEVILLSSEPCPFSEKHFAEFQNILPETDIRLVNGEMFSWYGSRMRLAAAYFLNLMNE